MTIDVVNNKSFCAYPFTHSYIGSKYERKLCCVSEDIPELQKTNLKNFWNSDIMKDVRLKMIAGEKISYCGRCYAFEEIGVPSLREEINRNFSSMEELTEHLKENGHLDSLPNFFDHRTIHCNLQCLSCGVTYSSTHINLHKKMYGREGDFKIDYEYEKEMSLDIINSLKSKTCKSIYWAGGEPMISNIHWDVMDVMTELHSNPNYTEYIEGLRIFYNTNLTKLYWKNAHIPSLLKFVQPSIQASLDGTHETFEYCRDGGNWEAVSNNWNEYYQYLNKNKQMGVASVLSSPVIMDIDRWFEFFEPYDPMIYNHKYITNTEYYPQTAQQFLDVRLFPSHIFDPIINHAIKRFEKSNLVGREKSIDILLSYKKEKYETPEKFDNIQFLKTIKNNTLYRDKFLRGNKTYEELLQIINPSAHEWYVNL